MTAFNNNWLCRYPQPRYIRFDKGSEFKAQFLETCTNYGVKAKVTTSHNPQANGIIEQVHQVLGNSLRTLDITNKQLETIDAWHSILSEVAFAIRSTYHTTLEATPGQLVFGHNMLLPISFTPNWDQIKKWKQA